MSGEAHDRAPDPGTVTRLIDLLRVPDPAVRDEAAQRIWVRYVDKLLALARQRIDQRMRGREDEEDIVVAMFQSFCARLGRGEFELRDRGALWNLLVRMTLNKVYDAADRHFSGKRDARREIRVDDDQERVGADPILVRMEAGDPTPDEAMALHEELQRLLQTLDDDTLRRVALLKLEGYTNDEIAKQLRCTRRTIERKMEGIRRKLNPDREGPDSPRVA